MTSIQIAEKVLRLFKEYEESLRQPEPPKYRIWEDKIEPFLDDHAGTSAFALTLRTFGWQYTNDVRDICRTVVDNNLL